MMPETRITCLIEKYDLYSPEIIPVPLHEDGIDVDALQQIVDEKRPKFIYLIPNFQNPTGLSYTEEVRARASEVFRDRNILVLEDNPYGELRFQGEPAHSFRWYLGEQCCMLGTFSKSFHLVCGSDGLSASKRNFSKKCLHTKPRWIYTPIYSAKW